MLTNSLSAVIRQRRLTAVESDYLDKFPQGAQLHYANCSTQYRRVDPKRAFSAQFKARTISGQARLVYLCGLCEFSMSGRRVLVADDLAPVLSAVEALLRESFEIVGMASDGQTALESAMKQEPDLVVLDISMPGMSGIEVARELKRRGNHAKVVFLTVHEDSDILGTALAAGGLGFVAKVLLDTDLIHAMNEALAGRVFVSRLSSQQDTP